MKNLGCHRDFNPGPLVLATSALTTELRQPSTSKTLESFNLVCMKDQNLIIVMIKPFQSTNYGSSLEGEVFPVDTEKVLCFFQTPLGEKVSI